MAREAHSCSGRCFSSARCGSRCRARNLATKIRQPLGYVPRSSPRSARSLRLSRVLDVQVQRGLGGSGKGRRADWRIPGRHSLCGSRIDHCLEHDPCGTLAQLASSSPFRPPPCTSLRGLHRLFAPAAPLAVSFRRADSRSHAEHLAIPAVRRLHDRTSCDCGNRSSKMARTCLSLLFRSNSSGRRGSRSVSPPIAHERTLLNCVSGDSTAPLGSQTYRCECHRTVEARKE